MLRTHILRWYYNLYLHGSVFGLINVKPVYDYNVYQTWHGRRDSAPPSEQLSNDDSGQCTGGSSRQSSLLTTKDPGTQRGGRKWEV